MHVDDGGLMTCRARCAASNSRRGLAALSVLLAALTMVALDPGAAAAGGNDKIDASPVDALVAEALQRNPEFAAATAEAEAARNRVSPAGALDDPMLEAGVINVPLDPVSLSREDMTMKMLGLGQKLPFPGKRGLRRAVAAADAEGIRLGANETANRIVRDVRVAYAELAAVQESQRLIDRTRAALVQLVSTTRSRFDVGLVSQSDVLEAQTELAMLATERQELDRDERIFQSELRRLLGRAANSEPVMAPAARLAKAPEAAESAAATALANRPQLQGLRALIESADKNVALAEREYYPDFDVGLQYGQRDRAPDGMPRDDMISLTVGVNLPIWRKSRLQPMVAEARSMRTRAQQMLAQGELETRAQIEEQTATAAQWRSTADTYRESLLPQAQAAAESALAAYRVGKVDFPTLRQAQLRVFELSRRQAQAIAAHNGAVAEIDLLTGRRLAHEKE